MTKMKVFLSYASSDAETGEEVRRALEEAGFEVWDPVIRLGHGSNFALDIGRALEDSDALVVLVSPEAMKSDWIRWELNHALGDPRFEGRLLPVELRHTDELPWILRKFTVLTFDGQKRARPIVEALHKIRDAA